jgi:hypothetical protein
MHRLDFADDLPQFVALLGGDVRYQFNERAAVNVTNGELAIGRVPHANRLVLNYGRALKEHYRKLRRREGPPSLADFGLNNALVGTFSHKRKSA